MRGRRHRAHFRRQDGIVFQPGGGMLLDSGGQVGSIGGDAISPQQATNAGSLADSSPGNEISATETRVLQTQVQPNSLPAGTATTSIAISSILFAPSAFQNVLSVTSTVSSSTSGSSATQSSSPTTQSSSSSAIQSSSSSSESLSSFSSSNALSASSIQDVSSTFTSLSVSQSSSASASSTPAINAIGHSTEFYAGIVFVAIVLIACLFAFAAWLVRSQRNRPAWCGGGREEDDVENQDLGFGLGLYLDKPRESFDSFLKSSTSLQDPPRSTFQGNPFTPSAFHGLTNSPGRYPAPTRRPPPAHLRSNNSVQSSNQVLGPLRVKNYVSGDFPSSCDEATLSPRRSESFVRDLGTPRETGPGTMPRFLGLGGQGLSVPWAPLDLDLKSSRSPSQVTIAHSPSTRSITAHTQEEEISPLPMPPFNYAATMKNEELPGSDGWGATLRSSIYNALSGLAGSNPKPEDDKDKFTSLPASTSHPRSRIRSIRWRNALSSRKLESSDMNSEDSRASSVCDAWTSPKAIDSGLSFTQVGPGMMSITSVALEVKSASSDVRDGTGNRAPFPNSTTPLVVKKKQSTRARTRSRLLSERTNAKTKHSASRSSSIYSPCPDAIGLQTASKRANDFASEGTSSKRGSINLISNRPRPTFLRQGTANSATSFSSEASESYRDLTDRELHAKRTMMLRARRKRGMGMGGGLGRRLTLSKQVSIRRAVSRSGSICSNSKVDDNR